MKLYKTVDEFGKSDLKKAMKETLDKPIKSWETNTVYDIHNEMVYTVLTVTTYERNPDYELAL